MNLDMANIIFSILDFQTVFTGFVCAYLLVISGCQEINEQYQGTYYMPLFFLALNLIIAGLVSLISLKPLDNEVGIATQIAKSIKIQILICNGISMLFFLFFTIFLMPQQFSIGEKKQHTFSHLDISRADAIWSLITGLFAQGFFLIYAEYMTSHYHKPAQYQANISIFFAFLYFCFVCLIGYLLAGFFGIACCAMGLITGPFCLISINIFAGFTSEAFAMSAVGCVFNEVRNKVYQLAWTTKNYSIFPQIIVAVGILLANLISAGASLIITQEEEVYIWDAYGLFGLLIGGSIIYLIKGTSTLGVKDVAENLKNNYDNAPFQGDDSNLRKVQTLVYSQYNNAIYKASFNIGIGLFNIAFIGLLLGSKALIAFLLGMNLVGIYLAFSSLIIGYSTKNAREYNRNVGELTQGDEVPIQTDIANTAIENVPGTSLVIYLIFFSLVILLGSKHWAQYGFFRKWADVDQNLQFIADSTTGWTAAPLSGLEKTIENMQKSMRNVFDGEQQDNQQDKSFFY
ncbi:proton-pumping vacuolar pyrophosphatase, putative [Ichthyophthirius multifiliis]|uniref:H(+)-exporting diphosphatase n=1 Tax=Ichthyophthirius multifiliis TaxID=5932 RepID=G0R3W6_ICHMU|nr:proton-pumping vacuolar pyrophosphatase, putative [Ichthyophthirius multifiliis]EGR27842.1 proton-pumping vacuolar pyrophosphatase, putative [Ichthyophthirius multifiliis]|eukprot:XP_004027187.1 proton-pumping vacuolar pyrophosphatase, putative [Ichthyophthirius multifiliis]